MEPQPPKYKIRKVATPAERKAILVDRSNGKSVGEIAAHYKISRSSVTRICMEYQKQAKGLTTLSGEPTDVWQARLRDKAVMAVEAGLDSTIDPYRRAGVGVKTLEGLGDFKTGHVQINNFQVVQRTPQEWKKDFIGLEEGDLTNG